MKCGEVCVKVWNCGGLGDGWRLMWSSGWMKVGVGGGVGRGLKEHSIPWKQVNTLVSLPP